MLFGQGSGQENVWEELCSRAAPNGLNRRENEFCRPGLSPREQLQ